MTNHEMEHNEMGATEAGLPQKMVEPSPLPYTEHLKSLMVSERKKRRLLRLILYVLVGIFLSLILRDVLVRAVSTWFEPPTSSEVQPDFDVQPQLIPERRYSV